MYGTFVAKIDIMYDGNLRVNDQILQVNGVKLLSLSAEETKNVMVKLIDVSEIHLKIKRWISGCTHNYLKSQ